MKTYREVEIEGALSLLLHATPRKSIGKFI